MGAAWRTGVAARGALAAIVFVGVVVAALVEAVADRAGPGPAAASTDGLAASDQPSGSDAAGSAATGGEMTEAVGGGSVALVAGTDAGGARVLEFSDVAGADAEAAAEPVRAGTGAASAIASVTGATAGSVEAGEKVRKPVVVPPVGPDAAVMPLGGPPENGAGPPSGIAVRVPSVGADDVGPVGRPPLDAVAPSAGGGLAAIESWVRADHGIADVAVLDPAAAAPSATDVPVPRAGVEAATDARADEDIEEAGGEGAGAGGG